MIGPRSTIKIGPKIGPYVGVLVDTVGAAAAAAPAFKAAGTAVNQTSIGTLAVPYPAGGSAPAANDIAICIVECGEGGGVPTSFSDAQGFVEGPDSGFTPDANVTTLRWFWKRCVGGDTNPTLADVASDNHRIAQILLFTGCVTSGNPYNVTAGDADAVSDTAVDIPGDITTVVNCLILAIVAWGTDTAAAQFVDGSAINASLTGLTERTDTSTTSGSGGGFAVITGVKAAAGAYSVTTGTLAATSVQARVSIALRSN